MKPTEIHTVDFCKDHLDSYEKTITRNGSHLKTLKVV